MEEKERGRLMKVISSHIGAPLEKKKNVGSEGRGGEYDEYDYRCVTVMNSGCGIEKGYRSLRVVNFKQGHRPVATAPLIALNVCVCVCFPCVHT